MNSPTDCVSSSRPWNRVASLGFSARLKPVLTGSMNTRSVTSRIEQSLSTNLGRRRSAQAVVVDQDAARAEEPEMDVGGRRPGPAVEAEREPPGGQALARLPRVGDVEDVRLGLARLVHGRQRAGGRLVLDLLPGDDDGPIRDDGRRQLRGLLVSLPGPSDAKAGAFGFFAGCFVSGWSSRTSFGPLGGASTFFGGGSSFFCSGCWAAMAPRWW